jgi:AICAR transformylase/IMP cyclohydrolase PurH (only IMP cyclohydrolase domain in Aful)
MGGILARRGQAQDDMDCATHGIPHIDVVVCTLYPFEETAKKGGALDELIEKIRYRRRIAHPRCGKKLLPCHRHHRSGRLFPHD